MRENKTTEEVHVRFILYSTFPGAEKDICIRTLPCDQTVAKHKPTGRDSFALHGNDDLISLPIDMIRCLRLYKYVLAVFCFPFPGDRLVRVTGTPPRK